MSKLSRDAVLKLAKLSGLKLTEGEIKRFAVELSAILEYVKTLDKVDTKSTEPTYQVTGLKNVMRADKEVGYQAKPAELIKNAPATEKNQFKVKRVL